MAQHLFSPRQCAAGRALAGCSAQALAIKAGVPLALVIAYEAGGPVRPEDLRRICNALWGRLFLRPIAETSAAGEGVRFRKTPAGIDLARQLKAMEGVVEPEARAALARRGRAA